MKKRKCRNCGENKSINHFRNNRTECKRCSNNKTAIQRYNKRYPQGNPAFLNLPDEYWVNIKGFEGKYMISNKGRVKSLIKGVNHSKIKSQVIGTTGYLMVMLSANGKKTIFKRVHRLLAQAFIPNSENKPCVNHKDGNKLNNNLSNLEWCTYTENGKHAYNTGLSTPQHGETHKHAKLKNSQVIEIFNSGKSKYELAIKFNISPHTVQGIIDGRSWGHLTGKFHPSLSHREKVWKQKRGDDKIINY